MSGKIDLYNLGSVGVDLTKSPLHKDDGSLVSAQNAVPDVRDEAGAIAKRDGLTVINSSALSGAVKGAVFVPLAIGGALATSGNTGRAYVGLLQTGTEGTDADYGWAYSSDAFATGGTLTTTAPSVPESAIHRRIYPLQCRRAAVVNNKIYYSTGNGNSGTSYTRTPAVRVFDGTVDREFARLPANPDDTTNSFAYTINCVFAVGTTIYLSVSNIITDDAEVGSVWSLDTTNGAFKRIGATFSTGELPGPLAWSLGRLWVGTVSTDATNSGIVYFIRPGIDSTWTADETMGVVGPVRDLVDYNGTLFSAVGRASYAITGTIYKRSPTDGTWASTESAATSDYPSMAVFNGNLYAVRLTAAAALIRKYNGTSWSTVYTEPNVALFYPDHLHTFNGVIYATGPQADNIVVGGTVTHTITDNSNDVITSTDGTTWTAYKTISTGLTADADNNVFAGIYI